MLGRLALYAPSRALAANIRLSIPETLNCLVLHSLDQLDSEAKEIELIVIGLLELHRPPRTCRSDNYLSHAHEFPGCLSRAGIPRACVCSRTSSLTVFFSLSVRLI